LLDRQEICDTLYRYASSADRFDYDVGLRSILDADIVATFASGEPLHGADAVVDYFNEFTGGCSMQHHLFNVYSCDVNDDRDRAQALIYHTSRALRSCSV
jgi:hypothetical protein